MTCWKEGGLDEEIEGGDEETMEGWKTMEGRKDGF